MTQTLHQSMNKNNGFLIMKGGQGVLCDLKWSIVFSFSRLIKAKTIHSIKWLLLVVTPFISFFAFFSTCSPSTFISSLLLSNSFFLLVLLLFVFHVSLSSTFLFLHFQLAFCLCPLVFKFGWDHIFTFVFFLSTLLYPVHYPWTPNCLINHS